MLANDIVHPAVFLGVGDAEIAAGDIAQIDHVLSPQRLVQPIFCFKVCSYLGRHGFVACQGVARHGVHAKKCGAGDKPDGHQAEKQTLGKVGHHDNTS